MTAASVLGVAITPTRASACRELLAGVASRGAWHELGALEEAIADLDAIKVRGPEGAIFGARQITVHALASCALGSRCSRCSAPIEAAGVELDDGWCCTACAERQRAAEAFRRRAATWLLRWTVPAAGGQLGLFGTAPSGRGRRR